MPLKKLPDGELEVMLAVWKSDRSLHTGEIYARLPAAKKGRIQALQVLLGRLAEKGFVRCQKTGRLNYYTPLVPEQEYRALETSSFIERMYGNSPARLVAALVEDGGLDERTLAEIRGILDGKGDE